MREKWEGKEKEKEKEDVKWKSRGHRSGEGMKTEEEGGGQK